MMITATSMYTQFELSAYRLRLDKMVTGHRHCCLSADWVIMVCIQYLDLRPDAMAAVASNMGSDVTVEELSKTVEELSRLH
jgi:hypothetical protein